MERVTFKVSPLKHQLEEELERRPSFIFLRTSVFFCISACAVSFSLFFFSFLFCVSVWVGGEGVEVVFVCV